jgi:tetratricopeptide (TPR) repeat protein
MKFKLQIRTFTCLFLFFCCFASFGHSAEFDVTKPAKLLIPKEIKKIFIDPAMLNDAYDELGIKSQVIAALKNRLNKLGRFEVVAGPIDDSVDPNTETVAIIQGDIISNGEIDEGQLTEQAECRGGISGLVGAATAKETSQQGITFSRRGMLCKKPNLKSQLVEAGLSAGLGMLGVQEFPRYVEVIRVYKYKNFSLFAQVNLSLTQLGEERETLTIQADAASFSRHVINPSTYRNVRESADNAPIIWLWFRITPIAPVIIEDIGIVRASNPGSYLGKWYERLTPSVSDIPEGERQQVITSLISKTLTEFIRTISPYKSRVSVEIASGRNKVAIENIEQGRFEDAKGFLENSEDPADIYNLGLTYEATARSMEDYEDALYFYSRALDLSPDKKLYAQGVGRMELQLRLANRQKARTSN